MTSRSIQKNQINKNESLQSDKSDFEITSTMKDTICSKMVKADFNGAHIEIVDSNNKQMIGIKGFVAKETQRSFIIVNIKNEQKIILKEKAVFKIMLPYIN